MAAAAATATAALAPLLAGALLPPRLLTLQREPLTL